MDRGGSIRRSASFKVDENLYKNIHNTIMLDYDDYLTIVMGHFRVVAEYHLSAEETADSPTENQPVFTRKYSKRRITMQTEVSRPVVVTVPPRRSSVPLIEPANPYDELLTDSLVPCRMSSPEAEFPPSFFGNREDPFVPRQKSPLPSVSGRVPVSEPDSGLSRGSSFNASVRSEPEASVVHTSPIPRESPVVPRHVSIIEIKPDSFTGISSYSPHLSSTKNVFQVTEIVPAVEIVLQETPKFVEVLETSRALDPTTDCTRKAFTDRLPAEKRAISPPMALAKSPEVKPRKSLLNGHLKSDFPHSHKLGNEDGQQHQTATPLDHMFMVHVQSAHAEITSILDGIPKRKMAPKPPILMPPKPKEDGLAELQRVLGNLREARKPADLTAATRKDVTAGRVEAEERGDEVGKVAATIQRFKKVTEEVEDLKDFLKSVRMGSKPTGDEAVAQTKVDVSTDVKKSAGFTSDDAQMKLVSSS